MNVNTQHGEHAAQPTNATGVPEELKEFVERFHVCWEALPDYYYVAVRDPLHPEVKQHKTEKRQIGFQLQLSGTHEAGVEHPQPGCEHCRKVWRALTAIAEWILPKEMRDTGYDLDAYDQSIRYDPVRNFRPEVLLTIWLRHRSGFDREVDACEVRCLNEMIERLKQLGARNGKWAST